MKYIFSLSGDYIKLGVEEVLSLFNVGEYNLLDNLLIVDLKDNEKEIKKLGKRLALTKSIYKLLFECDADKLIEIMKKYDWNSIYKDSFCLRINYLKNPIKRKSINEEISLNSQTNKKSIKNAVHKDSEKNLAGYIWRSVNKPKVDLESPKTKIELFIVNDKVYCGLLVKDVNENFESRKAHLRPFPHPSSLHPKLARALVNMTGIKENETLLDSFCGTGGFLIESGLMNIKIVGCDISKSMVKGCKENLRYFRIKRYKIINNNALNIKNKFDYAVTDLPYGLNSNVYLRYNKNALKDKSNKINLKINKKNQIKNIEKFYLKFLKKLKKILKKKAVIIFPSYVNYKKLLKSAKFKIEKEFEIYVHRSLTRNIIKIK